MSSIWLIWRLYFATSLFVRAGLAYVEEVDPMMKSHGDLTNFVSVRRLCESASTTCVVILIKLQEPDIKAPLFNITHYDEGAISPGYWFMDPYDYSSLPTLRAELLQIGAHIFDNRGV
jgi:hypothetical protein